MRVVPHLAAVLELKTRVHSVRWLDECYIGREEMVDKSICWRRLIFEASYAYMYSKISPLLVWTEKKGAYIWEDMVHTALLSKHFECS